MQTHLPANNTIIFAHIRRDANIDQAIPTKFDGGRAAQFNIQTQKYTYTLKLCILALVFFRWHANHL